eukprot:scaffold2636_cov340-Pavlova_lutheri.AAC.88
MERSVAQFVGVPSLRKGERLQITRPYSPLFFLHFVWTVRSKALRAGPFLPPPCSSFPHGSSRRSLPSIHLLDPSGRSQSNRR